MAPVSAVQRPVVSTSYRTRHGKHDTELEEDAGLALVGLSSYRLLLLCVEHAFVSANELVHDNGEKAHTGVSLFSQRAGESGTRLRNSWPRPTLQQAYFLLRPSLQQAIERRCRSGVQRALPPAKACRTGRAPRGGAGYPPWQSLHYRA